METTMSTTMPTTHQEILSELGAQGKILFNLLDQYKPAALQSMISNETLIPTLLKAEEEFHNKMIQAMGEGLNESQARELIWPEITNKFNL